jgi:hypothetical protein
LISYGGIPLAFDDAAVAASAEDCLAWEDFFDFPGCTVPFDLLQPPWSNLPLPRLPRVGSYVHPWGAGRFGVAHVLMTDAELARVRRLAYGAAGAQWNALPLILDDGRKAAPGVTTSLYLLPPRPLDQTARGNGMSACLLVDPRFRWWEVAATISVTAGTTTWAQLIAAIATALGVTITTDSISSAYLKPAADFAQSYEYLPPLLDAALAAIGQRLVRKLDGTLITQNPGTAKKSQDAQLAAYTKDRGGQFLFDARVRPNDLPGLAPAAVVVCFPDLSAGAPAAAPFAETVTLASLALAEYANTTAHSGQKVIRSTAAYGGSNGAELLALAQQVARDWYGWRLARQWVRFVGLDPYAPEALSDHVEWVTREGCSSTWVRRGPQPEWTLRHYGSAGGGGFLDVGPHWYFGGGTPGTAKVDFGPDAALTWPVAQGTFDLGYSVSYPLSLVFQYGSLTFPSTSTASVAPAAVLVIPTLTVTGPPTTAPPTAGQIICNGTYLYQSTPVGTWYPPYVPTAIVPTPTVPTVPFYDPVTGTNLLPAIITTTTTTTDLVIGINTPAVTTTAVSITAPTSTPTTVVNLTPLTTTQNTLVLTTITSQTADPLRVKDPSANILVAITVGGGVKVAPVVTTVTPISLYPPTSISVDIFVIYQPGSTATKIVYVDPNGTLITKAPTTGSAGLNLPAGTAPTTPVDGDLYYGGGSLFFGISGTGYDLFSVRVTGADTTPGYLGDKTVAGANITLTVLNPGGDEQLEIAATGGSGITTIKLRDSDDTDWTSTTDPTIIDFETSAFVIDNPSAGVLRLQGAGTSVPAAATDPATTQALANAIRQALIDFGFLS